jgi:biotin operon repressor
MTEHHTTTERWPIIGEILFDEHGKLPCDPPEGCDVCMLFSVPTAPVERARWVTELRRQFAESITSKPHTKPGETDRLLLQFLGDEFIPVTKLMGLMGVTGETVRQAVTRARRKGVQIESNYGRGYRLVRQVQSA